MLQSPYWEANWFAASQEIPRISRNPKVHHCTHKHLQPVLSPEQASRMWVFLNKVFYREGFLAPRSTPKLEDHSSSAARDCLFNLSANNLLIGRRSSIRNLRTGRAVVTGTPLHGYRTYTIHECGLWLPNTTLWAADWGPLTYPFHYCALFYKGKL